MSSRWLERVVCPYCDHVTKRSNLGTHLKGAQHRAQYGYNLVLELERVKHLPAIGASLPAVLELEEKPTVVPLSDLTAAEAITGILSATRTDGLIPTLMLPAVIDLVAHTANVLEELRRQTQRP